MEEDVKGTVTSLASLFPVEEIKKAAKRVDEAVVEKQKELDHIYRFSSDNTNLLKLVKRLPNELFHDVMVPFGKAAFFPGRLCHTNEFLVLLGEGYCAERTSKQTVDILERRGEFLKSQFDSLEAIILNLKAEASFFDTTATEAAEGLVEIREDYVEELPSERMSDQEDSSKSNLGFSEDTSMKAVDEYTRIVEKLDELEREELAAESVDESDEDDLGCSTSQYYFDRSKEISEDNGFRDPQEKMQVKSLHNTMAKDSHKGDYSGQNHSDQSILLDLGVQHLAKDEVLSGKSVVNNNATEKPLLYPESSEKIHVTPSLEIESSGSTPQAVAGSQNADLPRSILRKSGESSGKENCRGTKKRVSFEGFEGVRKTMQNPNQKVSVKTTPRRTSDTSKVFALGSIVEHVDGPQPNTDHIVGYNSESSQSISLNSSKRVSRFRMQQQGIR